MTSQIPKVFAHCHPPLILHACLAQYTTSPPPTPHALPQKPCIVNYSGRPLHTATGFPGQHHPLGKTCNTPPRSQLSKCMADPVSSSSGMASRFWGTGLAALLRVLKNRQIETRS